MAVRVDFTGLVALFGMNMACSWRSCIFYRAGAGICPRSIKNLFKRNLFNGGDKLTQFICSGTGMPVFDDINRVQ